MKLVGNVCIRNAFDLDYCIKECIESLLPVCDSVCVSDGESTDGTQEFLREWMAREPKIVLNVYKWPNPVGDVRFWTTWINNNREHIPKGSFQIQLDGDEVLCEDSYAEINELKKRKGEFTVCMDRLNFWLDTKHLIPPGVCLAHRVIRMGPQRIWTPSDGPDERGAEWVSIQVPSKCRVAHYGFLRRREAYFAKSKELHRMFFDTYDQRLVDAETKGGNWMREIGGIEWTGNLDDYKGEHPKVIHQWLRERNYDV